MTILVISECGDDSSRYMDLQAGKKRACVGYSFRAQIVTVCVNNASHRAWRGMGRTFGSFAEALDAYKSSEVKAMIQHLADACRPQLSIVE